MLGDGFTNVQVSVTQKGEEFDYTLTGQRNE